MGRFWLRVGAVLCVYHWPVGTRGGPLVVSANPRRNGPEYATEVLRIPKTGSSALGHYLMRKPQCKQRLYFHPNHPKSMERAYLEQHNLSQSSRAAVRANQPAYVTGSWNNVLADEVAKTVTVVRHPCQRFGSLWSAFKGLDVPVMHNMTHPDQLVEWLVQRYGHLANDPWAMAKVMKVWVCARTTTTTTTATNYPSPETNPPPPNFPRPPGLGGRGGGVQQPSLSRKSGHPAAAPWRWRRRWWSHAESEQHDGREAQRH